MARIWSSLESCLPGTVPDCSERVSGKQCAARQPWRMLLHILECVWKKGACSVPLSVAVRMYLHKLRTRPPQQLRKPWSCQRLNASEQISQRWNSHMLEPKKVVSVKAIWLQQHQTRHVPPYKFETWDPMQVATFGVLSTAHHKSASQDLCWHRVGTVKMPEAFSGGIHHCFPLIRSAYRKSASFSWPTEHDWACT